MRTAGKKLGFVRKLVATLARAWFLHGLVTVATSESDFSDRA